MTFPVRVVLDGDDLTIRTAHIREWLNNRGLDPGAFQYRLAGDRVELRIDLITLKDAANFAEAFGGIVLGIRPTAATVHAVINGRSGAA